MCQDIPVHLGLQVHHFHMHDEKIKYTKLHKISVFKLLNEYNCFIMQGGK